MNKAYIKQNFETLVSFLKDLKYELQPETTFDPVLDEVCPIGGLWMASSDEWKDTESAYDVDLTDIDIGLTEDFKDSFALGFDGDSFCIILDIKAYELGCYWRKLWEKLV